MGEEELMHLLFRKPIIGLALILLSFGLLLNNSLVMAFSPPTIQVFVEDVNGDGLKDLKFAVLKEGLAVPDVNISVFTGTSHNGSLFTGVTNSQGILTSFDVPGGSYSWVASEDFSISGNITIPTPEFQLTESEAIAWQTIAMTWIKKSRLRKNFLKSEYWF